MSDLGTTVTIILTPGAIAELDGASAVTKMSRTDVINYALYVYSALARYAQDGGLRKVEGGYETIIAKNVFNDEVDWHLEMVPDNRSGRLVKQRSKESNESTSPTDQ